jgi:L-alanine-DL-glutamate epimerase-like enolase superfamily enzyme
MSKSTDIKVLDTALYYLPVNTRVPLKFGKETVTHAKCARVHMKVENGEGKVAEGWGETPLSVTWVWPAPMTYDAREAVLLAFCNKLAAEWKGFDQSGHPMEIGNAFNEGPLKKLLADFNANERAGEEPLPWLAALVCNSAFDIAVHDAYGVVNDVETYDTYTAEYMNADLSAYLTAAEGVDVSFEGKYPTDFLVDDVPAKLPAWHLVGGKDLLDESELTGSEPDDGYPVILTEWIKTDGLTCLKIKLVGNDTEWDKARLLKIGEIAIAGNVPWLTADFNCTVTDPEYVNEILDWCRDEHPRIYGMILYVEQPFPYELEENRIDVHSVSSRKPLFMDESAHDWHLVKLGRSLGWTGVALKTCKTQTGALLTTCFAKAHGMTLMVQDLTNPALAQIPHCLLAANVGTIMGVETNSMQFYPAFSKAEEAVHPGLYKRNDGCVDTSTLSGPGFGYRLSEIKRDLPEAAVSFGG